MTIQTIIMILLIFLLPPLIVKLTRVNKFFATLGAIALCYLVGFVLSSLGYLALPYDKKLTETIAYVLVALSLPLILFSIDLREVKKLARNVIVGFSLCIVSVVIVSIVMFVIFKNSNENAHSIFSMIIGLYTGGTPNLNAIGALFNAGSDVISAANISDTIVGGLYFLFLISPLAGKLYEKILAPKKKKEEVVKVNDGEENKQEQEQEEQVTVTSSTNETSQNDYKFGFSIKDKKSVLKLFLTFLLSVGCLGVGAVLELLIEGTVGSNLIYILLSVSILGIVFSFIKPVREVKGNFTLGMYLILMFSLSLSMSIDWSAFLSGILGTMALFAMSQVLVIIIHIILCKIFKVDDGSAIVTSTAGVYGPPFIAPVCKAMKKENLIAPGVICGALGLAIGTILGYGVGLLLLLL